MAALELLAGLPGRRGAVLGEMLELGRGGEDGHGVVGEAAAGPPTGWSSSARAAGIATGARRRDGPARIVRVRDADAALAVLPTACATATSCWSRGRAASPSSALVDAFRAEHGDGPAR